MPNPAGKQQPAPATMAAPKDRRVIDPSDHPCGVDLIQRIAADVRIEIQVIPRPDRIRLQEPLERGRVIS